MTLAPCPVGQESLSYSVGQIMGQSPLVSMRKSLGKSLLLVNLQGFLLVSLPAGPAPSCHRSRGTCWNKGGCQITSALSPQHGQPGLGSCPFFCSPHLLQKGLSLSQERPEICNRDVGLNIHQTHFPDSKRDRSQSWHRNTVSGHQCGPTSRCTRKTPGVERCGGGPALSPGVVASEEGQRVAAESRAVAFPLLSNPPFLHRRAC